MFDIGWGELVVIGIVALIVIGPKELPTVLRSIGQWTGKIRRMAAEFQGQFQEAMREAEMADLKKHADDLNAAATSITSFDPMASAQKELDRALEAPADKPAAGDAETATAPEAEISVPLPEPPAVVSEADFAPPEPRPQKQAGGGA